MGPEEKDLFHLMEWWAGSPVRVHAAAPRRFPARCHPPGSGEGAEALMTPVCSLWWSWVVYQGQTREMHGARAPAPAGGVV